jgi:hypothetical protein
LLTSPIWSRRRPRVWHGGAAWLSWPGKWHVQVPASRTDRSPASPRSAGCTRLWALVNSGSPFSCPFSLKRLLIDVDYVRVWSGLNSIISPAAPPLLILSLLKQGPRRSKFLSPPDSPSNGQRCLEAISSGAASHTFRVLIRLLRRFYLASSASRLDHSCSSLMPYVSYCLPNMAVDTKCCSIIYWASLHDFYLA